MNWHKLRRDKLAKVHANDPRRRGAVLGRVADSWFRFLTLSWWEKGLTAGTALLLFTGVPIVLFALATGGGGGDAASQVAASGPTSTPAELVYQIAPTATITPTGQPTSTPAPVTATAEPKATQTPRPADRTDCAAIRGTAYRSPSERDWFVANCDEQSVSAPPRATDPGPTAPPSTAPPAPSPTPIPSFTASDAIALGTAWWLANEAPVGYGVNGGSCNASSTGGQQWVVNCQAQLPGCQFQAVCALSFSVCLIENPSTIWSC